MIDKYKNLDPQTRRTLSLAITLLVIIIISLVVLYVSSGSSGGSQQQTPQVQEIQNTGFNQRALEYVRDETNRDRPSLGGQIGRNNPFSNYE